MLDNFFENNGFTVLYPEKLSLKKMICLMNQAEICVFPSGTPSHNSLFVPEKSNIVIIEKQAIINKVQTAIDYVKKLSVCYIDGNYSPYPVTAGGGPFFYAFNRHFKKYADDNKLYHPDSCYINGKAKKRNVRQFLSLYHKWFCYGWATEGWQIQFADIIFQAHMDTADEIGEYLNGNTLFSIKQLLDPAVFRRIMKKL